MSTVEDAGTLRRSPDGSQRDDCRIARVIAVRLLDVLSPSCGPITVRVLDGVVLISGAVESAAMARAAEGSAWAISGVNDVYTQMTWPPTRRRWWNRVWS